MHTEDLSNAMFCEECILQQFVVRKRKLEGPYSMNIQQCTVFMHDGAACRCSKSAKQLLAEKSLATLDRLGNRPDLNAIENL